MVLFDISDIRLFWSRDSRFLSQFKAGQLNTKYGRKGEHWYRQQVCIIIIITLTIAYLLQVQTL